MYPSYAVDADGGKPNEANRYTVRFTPDQLPPVNAFWSMTMYDFPAQLMVDESAQPLPAQLADDPAIQEGCGRRVYALLSRMSPPVPTRKPTGCPRPKGPLPCCSAFYWPKAEALDGKWQAPPFGADCVKARAASCAPWCGLLEPSRLPLALRCAQSGVAICRQLGAKRTTSGHREYAAFDPRRTLASIEDGATRLPRCRRGHLAIRLKRQLPLDTRACHPSCSLDAVISTCFTSLAKRTTACHTIHMMQLLVRDLSDGSRL